MTTGAKTKKAVTKKTTKKTLTGTGTKKTVIAKKAVTGTGTKEKATGTGTKKAVTGTKEKATGTKKAVTGTKKTVAKKTVTKKTATKLAAKKVAKKSTVIVKAPVKSEAQKEMEFKAKLAEVSRHARTELKNLKEVIFEDSEIRKSFGNTIDFRRLSRDADIYGKISGFGVDYEILERVMSKCAVKMFSNDEELKMVAFNARSRNRNNYFTALETFQLYSTPTDLANAVKFLGGVHKALPEFSVKDWKVATTGDPYGNVMVYDFPKNNS